MRFIRRGKSRGGEPPMPVQTEPYTNLPEYNDGSRFPSDENTTEILPVSSELPAQPGDTQDTRGFHEIPDDRYHEYARDITFSYVERFFQPNNHHSIPLFDNKVATYMHEANRKFTKDELENFDEATMPHIDDFRAAREALDKETKPSFKRFVLMDGTKRRAEDKRYRKAKKHFDEQREKYLSSLRPTNEELKTPLARLTVSRSTYAKASAQKQNKRRMEEARTRYLHDFEAYYTEQHGYMTRNGNGNAYINDDKEEAHFAASFRDHELGALAGEEAYAAIEAGQSDSFLQRNLIRYNRLSTPKKVLTGLGVAGVAGVAFGAVGGVAAIGGMVGVRFARQYVAREASRRDVPNHRLILERKAVSFTGNIHTSLAERARLVDLKESSAATTPFMDTSYFVNHDASVNAERQQERGDKARVIGVAGLFAALPVVGGAVGGALLEHATGRFYGLFRNGFNLHFPTINMPGNEAPRRPDVPTPSERSVMPPPSDATPPPPETTPPAQSPVSPESRSLYGEYGGQSLKLTLEQPGASIWSGVSGLLDHQYPNLSYAEHERLTANIVDEVLRQNPTIQPTKMPLGSTINVKIPG